MSDGMKVSNPALDALSTANKNLVSASDMAELKILKKGSLTFTFVSSPASFGVIATVAHGLGYVPCAIVLMDLGTGVATTLPTTILSPGQVINCRTDTANLEVTYDPGLGPVDPTGGTYDFEYYVFDATGL